MTTHSHGPADADSNQGTSDPAGTTPAEDTTASTPATNAESETESHDRHRDGGKTKRRGSAEGSTAFPDSSGGRLGSVWIGLVLGALVTILLLVFIVQNSASADVQYFGWTFMLPLGVLVLCAAIAGALIMALFAGVRILQLRMRAHKARKAINRH